MRMYHADLETEVDIPDDPDCIAVHEASGWVVAPKPVRTSPAFEPEPVKPEPAKPEQKGKS